MVLHTGKHLARSRYPGRLQESHSVNRCSWNIDNIPSILWALAYLTEQNSHAPGHCGASGFLPFLCGGSFQEETSQFHLAYAVVSPYSHTQLTQVPIFHYFQSTFAFRCLILWKGPRKMIFLNPSTSASVPPNTGQGRMKNFHQ